MGLFSRFRKRSETIEKFDTVIIDECFISGTKIITSNGLKNIEDIKIGEIVANAKGWGRVYNKIIKKSDKKIKGE